MTPASANNPFFIAKDLFGVKGTTKPQTSGPQPISLSPLSSPPGPQHESRPYKPSNMHVASFTAAGASATKVAMDKVVKETSDLTQAEMDIFKSDKFIFGSIPETPPPTNI
jgi:hypothetical protein